jgi:hypothetical protein
VIGITIWCFPVREKKPFAFNRVAVDQGRPTIHVRCAPKADITLVNEYTPLNEIRPGGNWQRAAVDLPRC